MITTTRDLNGKLLVRQYYFVIPVLYTIMILNRKLQGIWIERLQVLRPEGDGEWTPLGRDLEKG